MTELAGYLLRDERILWQGKPNIRDYVFRGAWYLIPFSLLWGGFAIFWEIGVLTAPRAPVFFAILGIPFVLFGLYLMVGRFFVASREAINTSYAITDRRVLIIGGAFRRTFTAIEVTQLPEMQLDQGRNGRGSITFGSSPSLRMPPGWPTMGAYRQAAAFHAIDDVRQVFDTLQRARYDLTSRTIHG